jgi:hypothetical protein
MKIIRSLGLLTVVVLVGGIAWGQGRTASSSRSGRVVKVEGNNLIVAPLRSEANQITIPTDANTVVVIGRGEANLADLQPSMLVTVTPSEGVAERIVGIRTVSATTARAASLQGQVVKVDGNTVIVKTITMLGAEANDVVVPTDGKTTITLERRFGALEELKPGMWVVVRPPTGTAASVDVVPSTTFNLAVNGKVLKVEGNNVVVKTRAMMIPGGAATGGGEVTIATDANTSILLDGKVVKVADLEGATVGLVTPPLGTAIRIIAIKAGYGQTIIRTGLDANLF